MPLKLTGPAQPVVRDQPQTKYTDENRPIGAKSILGGRQVVWAGPDWRWQSPKSFGKLKSSGKLNRSIFSDPLGVIGNELRYIGRQAQATNQRAQQGPLRSVGQAVTRALPGVNVVNALPTVLGKTGRNLQAGLTVGAAENAAKLGIALTQKVRGRPANPENAGANSLVERISDASYRVLGATPPGQQNQFERGLDAVARGTGAGIVGTAVAAKAIPAIGVGAAGAVVTGGLRLAAGEVLSTFFDDNRGGNLANLGEAFGRPLPLSVNVGEDDWIDSAVKSLIPNAIPGLALGGVGEAAGGFKNTRRWLRDRRTVSQVTDARTQLGQAGITQTDPATGATAFKPTEPDPTGQQAQINKFFEDIGETDQPQTVYGSLRGDQPAAPARPPADAADPAPAPEATPAPKADAEPAAAPTAGGELEVEGVEIDPFELIYDPELPEADVVFNLVRDLDDTDLQALLAQPGPVVPRIDEILAAREAAPVRPELEQGRVMAPAESVAERIGGDGQPLPYEQTLEAMPLETLRGVAAPENNPALAQLIGDITGREFEEFTKADIIEGLAKYREQSGQALLVRDWQQSFRPTGEIQADPQRFQFKQGVNEVGEQAGNSLAGVDRWDTVAEGTLDVWTDPANGVTYVVNGHNRLARARQLGIPTVPVRELPAATAEEARALGALANIKEGRGTVFDAAKFMRDSGITDPEQLQRMGAPMTDGHAARGLALAQLPDNIFQAAVDGRLSVGKAAAIGGSGLDETQMQSVMKILGDRDLSDSAFSEVIQQVRSAPVVKQSDGAQTTLLELMGMSEEALSLAVEKGKLAAKIRAELISDKNLFGKVGKKAERLQQAGNKISVEGSAMEATDARTVLGIFDAVKYAPGPVSSLLDDGAKQIADGAKPGVVANRIRDQIVDAVRQSAQEQGLPTARPAGAAAEPAPQAPELDPETQAILDEMEDIARSLGDSASRNAEMARRGLEASAGIEDIDGTPAIDRVAPSPRLTPEQRQAMQLEVIRRAVDEAEVRPPETPIPELPDGPALTPDLARADLETRGGQVEPGTPAAQAMADEIRLAAEFAERDAQMRAIAEEGAKDAMGYELKTFEEKKALGMTDGYDPAIDENAPRGWDAVDGNGRPVNSPDEIAELEKMATNIIRKVAGDDVSIRFSDTYKVGIKPAQWGGDGKKLSRSAGSYNFVEDMITIRAMKERGQAAVTDASYHEAFHRIQYVALGEKEVKVLDGTFARLKIASGSGHIMRDGAVPSYSESQAVAFARYATAKAMGEDPIEALVGAFAGPLPSKTDKAFIKVIAAFDRVLDFVEKVYNLLANGTFDSTRAIFERTRIGALSDTVSTAGTAQMLSKRPPGWRVSTADGTPLGGSTSGPDMQLAPAPVRPEPMKLADSDEPPAKPRPKKADQAARQQIQANEQRMAEIRRKAQQEGC
jgi:hypothetical protein